MCLCARTYLAVCLCLCMSACLYPFGIFGCECTCVCLYVSLSTCLCVCLCREELTLRRFLGVSFCLSVIGRVSVSMLIYPSVCLLILRGGNTASVLECVCQLGNLEGCSGVKGPWQRWCDVLWVVHPGEVTSDESATV